MRQIVLISRIHPRDNKEEFSKYSEGDEPVLKEAEGLRLLIIKGSALNHYSKHRERADAILKATSNLNLDVNSDTIITYHFDNNIDEAIRAKFKSAGWTRLTIREYSTKGNEQTEPVYKILNALGAAIKSDPSAKQANEATAKLIEKLWLFFSHDPADEAKHRLLQSIIVGEVPQLVAEELKEYQGTVDTFSAETKGKSIFSDEYKEAYVKLLDALGLEK